MNSNNWRPSQDEPQPPPPPLPPPSDGGGDWRSHLQPDSRPRIVSKITETLKSHLPSSGQEGVQELKQIAIRFEEKIYSAATSQSDYLRKISLKMLTMESRSQSTLSSAMPSNSAGRNPQDPASSQNIQSQVHNRNQLVPLQMVPNQSQARQPLLTRNIQNNIVSAAINLPSTLPTNGLVQNPMSNASQNSNQQNISGITLNPIGNTVNQGIASSMLSNAQRQLQGRQQTQTQNSQQFIDQQQQNSMLQNKFQQQNILQPLTQPQQQQQQQQIKMHSSVMQSSMISGMQQNRQPIQHQSVIRQHQQHPQQTSILQQQPVSGPQLNAGNMQQSQPNGPQLIGQQPNGNMQQSQVIDQQPNVVSMQQSQPISQQTNIQRMHQQQMGHQNHVGRPKPSGTLPGNASIQTNQRLPVHELQQTKVPVQSETNNALTGSDGQPQLQSQSQRQLISQLQSHSTPLQQQLASLDSTAHTGNVNVSDWQEEVYQKIKSMKDLYYADLNEMYQKISFKLQQHDSVPQQPKIDQIETLRGINLVLERIIHLLQITKNNILLSYKDKLPAVEKQIVSLLNPNRPRKHVPSMPQGQIMTSQPNSIRQSHPQIPQPQSHHSGANPPLQSMDMPGSAPTLSAITSLEQNMLSSLQPGSNFDLGQASAPSSLQPLNTVVAPQKTNISSFEPLNVNSLHTGPNILHSQHLKQQQEQQTTENQQLKVQNRRYINHLQKHASQMQANQILQSHPLNDVNEKMRHLRSGAFPQHLASTQRFVNQQLRPGEASFPVSSPQIHQHSSPRIDQQNVSPPVPKVGTPLNSVNSPFAPSPSTPLVPSPMPGNNDKSAVSLLANAANDGQHQTNGAPHSSIGTPGISPSPLFECAGPDSTLDNASTVSGKSSLTETPIERLLRAIKSVSSKALSAAVSDMSSVVSMVDRIAGSTPGNGSRATVGEDLVTMTNCRLQAKYLLTPASSGTKRIRQYISAMPLNVGASFGSMDDSFKQLNGPYSPELELAATSDAKKARMEVNHALLKEIREINERLIDTVVDISDEDLGPSMASPAVECSEGTIVKCSYNAITLSSSLRLQNTSAEMSPIQPLVLLVPNNYPACSPVLLDKLPVGVSNEHEDLSVKAKSRFSIWLRSLSQPMSLKDIARTWDDSARAVISEYAQRFGGGTFSSKYGTWENCLTAA